MVLKMEHLDVIRSSRNQTGGVSVLQTKASGEYFTPETVGRRLVQDVLRVFKKQAVTAVNVVDPFCGDGRLLIWLLEEMMGQAPHLRGARWNVFLWDISEQNVLTAIRKVTATISTLGIEAHVYSRACDSFEEALSFEQCFDIVVTNPPWESIKPDKRELSCLDSVQVLEYVEGLKNLTKRLSRSFPRSLPSRSFSGWGLNLSRVGFEASLRLLTQRGIAGVVMPISFLADQTSAELRQWWLEGTQCHSITLYPAEARLFEGVDQAFSTIVSEISSLQDTVQSATTVINYDQKLNVQSKTLFNLGEDWIKQSGYCIPVSLSVNQVAALRVIQSHTRMSHLEGMRPGELWIGREVDETNLASFTSRTGQIRFLKGINIESYRMKEDIAPIYVVLDQLERVPSSAQFARLVWRDVSRPSQKRRMRATIIPPGAVTGNSLNVLHEWQQETEKLLWFLAVTTSLAFEFQIRALLKTGHVSSGAVRRSAVPSPKSNTFYQNIVELVKKRLEGDEQVEATLEVSIAQCYGLDREAFSVVLECFPKLSLLEKKKLLDERLWKSEHVW